MSIDGQGQETLPLEIAQRVEAVSRQFRSAWQRGERPRIEVYLEEVDPAAQTALLRALLRTDIACRRQQGENPRPADYAERFADHGELIAAEVIASETDRDVGQGSTGGGSHVKLSCPHCHNPIEVAEIDPRQEVSCPSCGSSFSLIDDRDPSTRMLPTVRQLGQFELVEQLGTGTFGSVWKARDTKLDRIVAVKVPRREQLAPEEVELFLREARAAAQIRHPNIVSVHEVGRHGDTVFIVSDLIRGVTLSDWLSAQQPTARQAAELCAVVAEALHHAHEVGVVHRDLKPGNIMLDAAGRPHLMDFGLAKREEGEITMTVEGRVLGTPAYMSPEQARGEGHTVRAIAPQISVLSGL